MLPVELKRKFIDLRAEGRTLRDIAAALKISKNTALDWNQKYRHEINEARRHAVERLLVDMNAGRFKRAEALAGAFKKFQNYLESKEPSADDLPVYQFLIRLDRRLTGAAAIGPAQSQSRRQHSTQIPPELMELLLNKK